MASQRDLVHKFNDWSEIEVAAYFKEIGLGAYTEPLIKHKINGRIVPFVKDTDLKEMGVNIIGDRISIQNQIQELQRSHRKEYRTKTIWSGEEQLFFGGEKCIATCCFICPIDPSIYTLMSNSVKIKLVEPYRCCGRFKFTCCNEYKVDNVDLAQVVDVDVLAEVAPFPICCLAGKDRVIIRKVQGESVIILAKGEGETLADLIKHQVEETHMQRNINVQKMNRN